MTPPMRAGPLGFPRLIWCIAAAYAGVLLCYATVFPSFRAPDEAQHIDLAHLLATELTYPDWDEREVSPEVSRALHLVDFHTGSRSLTLASAPDRAGRPTFEELAQPPRPGSINQLTQHPPLYYVYLGLTARATDLVLPGDPLAAWDLEVWSYRLASVAMTMALPFAIWATARRLRLSRPVAMAATLVPMAIPQVMHIGASVNNDALSNLSWWIATPLVLALGSGDLRVRTSIAAGAVTGVGMLTKQPGLLIAVWVALAIAIGWRRSRVALPVAARSAAVSGIVAVGIGGWWWIRNVVAFGQLAPSRFRELLPAGRGPGRDLQAFVETWAWRNMITFWGGFGMTDFRLPTALCALLTAVAAACIGAALVARRTGIPVGDRLLLLTPLVLLAGTTGVNSLQFYRQTSFVAGAQGRYWFGALVGASLLIASGLGAVVRQRSRWLPPAVAGVALLLQASTGRLALERYYGNAGESLMQQLVTMRAWSPLPPPLLYLILVLSLLASGVTLLALTLRPASHRGSLPVAGERSPRSGADRQRL